MSKATRGLAILGMASAMAFAGPALAQDTGFYGGLSFGQSSADVDCSGLPQCDDSDTAWRILGGYRFNRNLAVELGYTDFGEVSAGDGGANNVTAEATAFELVAVGSLPLSNEFSVYGKIGMFRWDVDATGTGVFAGSESDSGTDVTFGVGVQYDFTRQLGLRGEWQRYSADEDIDVISIGVVFRF
jgi:OOP family OmpA-OmpF porin